MKTNIELFDAEDIEVLLYDQNAADISNPYRIPIRETEDHGTVFGGFHFFRPSTIFKYVLCANKPTKFLLANESPDKNPKSIIGILKFGVYNMFNSVPDYWAVNYVDVRQDRRRQGICRSLFEELNHILTPDDWLVGTFLSHDAEEARLNEKIPKWVNVCPYFQDNEEFGRYCKERGLMLNVMEEVK